MKPTFKGKETVITCSYPPPPTQGFKLFLALANSFYLNSFNGLSLQMSNGQPLREGQRLMVLPLVCRSFETHTVPFSRTMIICSHLDTLLFTKSISMLWRVQPLHFQKSIPHSSCASHNNFLSIRSHSMSEISDSTIWVISSMLRECMWDWESS